MRFYRLDLVTPPAALPVTEAEFIDHARLNGITVQRQPELIARELAAATDRGQEFCRRSFLEQTLSARFIPGGVYSEVIQLPRGRVASITSITAAGGIAIDPAGYSFDAASGVVIFGAESVPSSAVVVQWVSGFGPDAASVPAALREGLLEYATVIYGDRRGSREIKATSDTGSPVPPGVEDLWAPFRLELAF